MRLLLSASSGEVCLQGLELCCLILIPQYFLIKLATIWNQSVEDTFVKFQGDHREGRMVVRFPNPLCCQVGQPHRRVALRNCNCVTGLYGWARSRRPDITGWSLQSPLTLSLVLLEREILEGLPLGGSPSSRTGP